MRTSVAQVAVTSLALAACGEEPYKMVGSDNPDNADVIDASPYPDAPLGPDAAGLGAGRVCVLDDLRDWASCEATGVGGLTVTLRDDDGVIATTETDATGRFQFALPAQLPATAVLRVAGGAVATSATIVDQFDDLRLPAPLASHWLDVQAGAGLFLPESSGSVALRLFRDGAAASGVSISAQPIGENPPIYDDVAADAWDGDATASAGVAIVAGLPLGAVTLLGSSPAGSDGLGTLPVTEGELLLVDTTFAPR
jgi:hypothetical protein